MRGHLIGTFARHLDDAIFEGFLGETSVRPKHPRVVTAQPCLVQVPQLLISRFLDLTHHKGRRRRSMFTMGTCPDQKDAQQSDPKETKRLHVWMCLPEGALLPTPSKAPTHPL